VIISGIMANGMFYIPKTGWNCGRMAVADLNNNHGVIDEDGNPIGRIKYKKVLWFNRESYACQTYEGHVVILDKDGSELSDKFEDAQEIYGQYALGMKKGQWCYVNTEKRKTSKPFIDELLFWRIDSGGIVRCGDRYSAITPEGRLLAKFIYDDVHHLNEGKFALKLKGKYAVAGPKGMIVPDPILEKVHLFKGGVAVAVKDGESGYVTEKGWSQKL